MVLLTENVNFSDEDPKVVIALKVQANSSGQYWNSSCCSLFFRSLRSWATSIFRAHMYKMKLSSQLESVSRRHHYHPRCVCVRQDTAPKQYRVYIWVSTRRIMRIKRAFVFVSVKICLYHHSHHIINDLSVKLAS